MAKPDSYHRRARRRKKQGKVTVRQADGTVQVVKPGHFSKQRRDALERNANRKAKRAKRRTAYQLYLLTPHWKNVRRLALARDGNRCRGCGGQRRLQVHHLTYERLHRELLSDVVTLCAECHRAEHKGVKRKAA